MKRTRDGVTDARCVRPKRNLPQQTIIPCKIQNLEVFSINTSSESYRAHLKLHPYKDKDGKEFPIDHIRELVPAVNRHLKICENHRAFKTYVGDIGHKQCETPSGMHMFETPVEIHDRLAKGALRDMHRIYKDSPFITNSAIHMLPANKPPTNKILFYSKSGPQPSYKDVMKILQADFYFLWEYTKIYARVIKEILEIDQEEFEKVSLSLVHYDKLAGLNPHVDTVHIFEDTLGPIFTIAMGQSTKMLDMLPVLLDGKYQPVRLYSKPNQIMVMDGISRILWAHAKPWGYKHEQFTLVFKFPGLSRKKSSLLFRFENTEFEIPSYVS